MLFSSYAAPASPDEVIALLGKRNNRIAAGNLWLRMSRRTGGTMIDLKNLGWDQIEETDDAYLIGASVTLHMLETHPGLNAMTGNLFADAFRAIVGVQFRNAATVGGSLYMRAGFSDLLTALLPLNAAVLLYPEKEIPLAEYARLAPAGELIRGVRIPKQEVRVAYRALRNTAGSVPVLTCAVAARGSALYAAIGARPMRAELIGGPGEAPESLAAELTRLTYGTNRAASEAYRRHVAGVLFARCAGEITGKETQA
ncbi:MAG: FAD binding domain-containing protein [Clostridia bacterium]|nr:FAD binding domain-containing protein [Clostridia bacterium]